MSGLSVLIPDGEHEIAFKVMTCLAQAPGTKIHLIAVKKHPRARYSRFRASFALRERGGENAWFEQIRDIVEKERVDVILPAYLEAVRFVSTWRDRFSEFAALPLLPESHTFDLVADKQSLARFLREHDFPTPKTSFAASALEDTELVFPLMVKPRRAAGGRGIRYCPDQKTLKEFVDAHRESLDEYVVQEFIEGRDRSCSVLCDGGKILAYTIHERITAHQQGFAPTFCIRLISCAQTIEIVTRLMSALKWTGIANIGFRYDPRRPAALINDFNPRFWGNLVGSMAAGVNFPYLACLAAVKRPLPESQYRLQEYMEVRDVADRVLRKLKGYGGVLPNLMRETNLPFMLRDPVPFLNRFIDR